ncbi:glycosyltransferase [Photobacterium alginatilyticum]|uniref:glycosyltransferase n=1 Tax=Photobacterium alginatilyticum TaxID=1775171 RepID=UPI0040676D36
MKKNVCLIYSWENFRANYLEKDVGLFPKFFAKSSCEELDKIIFDSIDIEEKVDGKLYKSKSYLHFIFDCLRFNFNYLRNVKYFILFHVSLRTGLLAKLLKLINPSSTIVVKTDLSLSNVRDFTTIKKNNPTKYKLMSTFNKSIDAFCVETTQSIDLLVSAHADLVEKDKIYHVPNGVITSPIFSEPTKKDEASITIITRDDCDLKGVDRITPLLQSIDEALGDNQSLVKVRIVGPLSDSTRHEIISSTETCTHIGVELLGSLPKEDTLAILCKSEFFINLSVEESYCFALVEAALANCHIITTPVGVAADLSSNYSNIDILDFCPRDFSSRFLHHLDAKETRKPDFQLAEGLVYDWEKIVDDFYNDFQR